MSYTFDEGLLELSEADLILRIRIAIMVMEEARNEGDERWKSLAEQQVVPLQAALAELKKRKRQAEGLPEPEPIVIHAKVGHVGAKTNLKE